MFKSENESIAKWKALEINGILFLANICATYDSNEIYSNQIGIFNCDHGNIIVSRISVDYPKGLWIKKHRGYPHFSP